MTTIIQFPAPMPSPRKPRRYTPRARSCKCCGESFRPARKAAKYCSVACRVKAHRQKQAGRKAAAGRAGRAALDIAAPTIGRCAHCDKGFWRLDSRPRLYCGASCRSAAYKTRQRAALGILAAVLGYERASDVISTGMPKTSALLAAMGFQYDASRRTWARSTMPAAAM